MGRAAPGEHDNLCVAVRVGLRGVMGRAAPGEHGPAHSGEHHLHRRLQICCRLPEPNRLGPQVTIKGLSHKILEDQDSL